jgi:ABC-type spermidine/putrescine transport system permease subunit I
VPLGHLFTAAYVFIVAVYLLALSGMEEEANTPSNKLVAYVFPTYIVFIIVAVVGMFVAYVLEDLFVSGLKSWHIVAISIPILIFLLVRAYSNFVNKHF